MSVKINECVSDLFENKDISPANLNDLHLPISDVHALNSVTLGLIDRELLNEIQSLLGNNSVSLYFGKTLRDIKCVIQEENGLRHHEIFVKYKAPRTLAISSVNLPHSLLQDREYKTIEEIITSFRTYVNELSSYFYELEKIDHICTVMEPIKPTFKDDFRRVLLDERTWLHVEVTPEGEATNIHLVGNSELWHDKLQRGLLSWDRDKDIVENIMSVFDITEFPVLSHKPQATANVSEVEKLAVEEAVCGICLCDELPDNVGLPQPLCQNPTCGVFFHRNCLYQWLVACSGNRPPAFGVATGACPTCLQPIACSE